MSTTFGSDRFSPCLNLGTCMSTLNLTAVSNYNVRCACIPGFSGSNCQTYDVSQCKASVQSLSPLPYTRSSSLSFQAQLTGQYCYASLSSATIQWTIKNLKLKPM